MNADHNIVRRLAFVRYLYETAIAQSRLAQPWSAASLLTMHDSVELFLHLATESLNVAAPRDTKFMDYFERLSKKLGRDLEQQESMRRLNTARISLKHGGTLPSPLDIEAFRASVTNFFAENTFVVFQVNLNDISLVEFVSPESARKLLQDATALIDTGTVTDALNLIAEAFAVLIRDYETRKRDRFYQSPFHFIRDHSFDNAFSMGLGNSVPRRFGEHNDPLDRRKLGQFVDNVRLSLASMQDAIKILALGLDFKKYSRFRQLTPTIAFTGDSCPFIATSATELNPTLDEARFCIDFVIESSLALSEFDYTVNHSNVE